MLKKNFDCLKSFIEYKYSKEKNTAFRYKNSTAENEKNFPEHSYNINICVGKSHAGRVIPVINARLDGSMSGESFITSAQGRVMVTPACVAGQQ